MHATLALPPLPQSSTVTARDLFVTSSDSAPAVWQPSSAQVLWGLQLPSDAHLAFHILHLVSERPGFNSGDMEPKLVYRCLRQLSVWVTDNYYNDVVVEGADNVPETGPVIL